MTDQRLSANALAITDAEYKALLEIRELFADNRFHHDPRVDADKPDGFNMLCPLAESKCGTTACIGGWMFEAMKRDRTTTARSAGNYVSRDRSNALRPLFYPFIDDPDVDCPYDVITPDAALAAIDNFLSIGDPDWHSILVADEVEDDA